MEQVLIKEKSAEENFRIEDCALGCNIHSRFCRFSLAREVPRYSWSQYFHQLHFYLLPALLEQCNRTQDRASKILNEVRLFWNMDYWPTAEVSGWNPEVQKVRPDKTFSSFLCSFIAIGLSTSTSSCSHWPPASRAHMPLYCGRYTKSRDSLDQLILNQLKLQEPVKRTHFKDYKDWSISPSQLKGEMCFTVQRQMCKAAETWIKENLSLDLK